MNPIREFWCHKILPLVYDNSLSYFEVLCKVTAKINEIVDTINNININENIVELVGRFTQKDGTSKKYEGALNQLLQNGIYSVDTYTSTNFPIDALNGKYNIHVNVDANSEYVEQTLYPISGSQYIYYRTRTAENGWGTWCRLLLSDELVLNSTSISTSKTMFANEVRKSANRVYINLVVETAPVAIGTNVIGTIPAGFRPTTDINTTLTRNGVSNGTVVIHQNGFVEFHYESALDYCGVEYSYTI